MNHLLTYSILAGSLIVLSDSGYGEIPITSLPFTISTPGTYVFANNLSYSIANGDAIKVNAADATIDLNGYYLHCSVSGNHAVGIYLENSVNSIRVKNGKISGFYIGEVADGTGAANTNFGHLLEDVRFYDNFWSVYYVFSRACVVKNCEFIGGTYGIEFINGTGNRVTNNVASVETQGFISSGTERITSIRTMPMVAPPGSTFRPERSFDLIRLPIVPRVYQVAFRSMLTTSEVEI